MDRIQNVTPGEILLEEFLVPRSQHSANSRRSSCDPFSPTKFLHL